MPPESLMSEPKGSSGGRSGCGGGEPPRAAPKLITSGDRQLLTVELRPGETTYVSWKKLMKDANKVNDSASEPDPPLNANPSLESRLATDHPAENEMTDQAAPNRFSAVIEKIERLYMGKDSSDEEELDSSPDDDEYDTEDSFIDDAELDEYFEVDNSAIKHDGFFVNRGKLERIHEPPTVSNQQPKKRHRKDLEKAHGDIVEKQVKVGKTKVAPSFARNYSNPSPSSSIASEYANLKARNQANASGLSSKKKYADAKVAVDSFSSFKVSREGASLSIEDVNKMKSEPLQPKTFTSHKLKEVGGSSDALHQKYSDKSACPQSKSQPRKPSHDDVVLEAVVRQKGKNGMHDLTNANISESKQIIQMTKHFYTQRRDGSNVRPKSSMLEKAIRELEKVVAESRPSAPGENQEADASSQAVKRRLPREVKLKLAKVARVAATQGKISKDLINRLMSIVGHYIQLRSLKRNLKIMINMGMSANKEKDDRFQQIKKEVIEMIRTRVPSMESQALEQQAGASVGFQEVGSGEKGPVKKKFIMDMALEEKICDLYDLFVDGLDEEAGPQIRKLYVELADMWPNRLMDNHGIKRAICRAKERRRALNGKDMDQEKMRRKKPSAPKSEEAVQAEPDSNVRQQHTEEKMPVDPSTTANDTGLDRSKQQEKSKGSCSSSNFIGETKKLKRKADPDLDSSHLRSDKLPAESAEERPKSSKQQGLVIQKPNISQAPPS